MIYTVDMHDIKPDKSHGKQKDRAVGKHQSALSCAEQRNQSAHCKMTTLEWLACSFRFFLPLVLYFIVL